MAETTKQNLLRKAAHQIGIDSVAVGLKVPQALVEAWMRGKASMPDRKFLMLADLLDKLSKPEPPTP